MNDINAEKKIRELVKERQEEGERLLHRINSGEIRWKFPTITQEQIDRIMPKLGMERTKKKVVKK